MCTGVGRDMKPAFAGPVGVFAGFFLVGTIFLLLGGANIPDDPVFFVNLGVALVCVGMVGILTIVIILSVADCCANRPGSRRTDPLLPVVTVVTKKTTAT
jgi:hypothetical protein